MKEIKFLISIVIVLVFHACQGRDMPIKTVDSKPIADTNTSVSVAISKDKKKEKSVHTQKKKVPQKKKTVTATLKSQTSVVKKPKTPSIKNLPPLPTIEKPKQIKKVISKLSHHSIDEIINTKVAQPRESFSGGDIVDKLDMATIRIGKSSDYTSIIFDSYIYEGKDIFPSEKASTSGIYLFTYEPSKKRIVGIIDGYNAFSALLSDQHELFSDNKIVKNIYILKHLGQDGIKFAIKLRKNVRVNIFDVKNPGRIIVNLFPL